MSQQRAAVIILDASAWEPSPEEINLACGMVGVGVTRKQLGAYFGVGVDLLNSKMGPLLDREEVHTIATVAQGVIAQAKAGNLDAAKFFLSRKGGWKEPGQESQDETPGKKDMDERRISAHAQLTKQLSRYDAPDDNDAIEIAQGEAAGSLSES